jgi:hypothetical protein
VENEEDSTNDADRDHSPRGAGDRPDHDFYGDSFDIWFGIQHADGLEAVYPEDNGPDIDDEDLGNITIGNRIGPRINMVRVENVGGQLRVRVIFARWMTFAEIRGGYRSTDYPFSYMEMFVDPRTGRGDGTFIAAAKIRFRRERNEIEIEDFGTFPGRLMGIRMRGSLLS